MKSFSEYLSGTNRFTYIQPSEDWEVVYPESSLFSNIPDDQLPKSKSSRQKSTGTGSSGRKKSVKSGEGQMSLFGGNPEDDIPGGEEDAPTPAAPAASSPPPAPPTPPEEPPTPSSTSKASKAPKKSLPDPDDVYDLFSKFANDDDDTPSSSDDDDKPVAPSAPSAPTPPDEPDDLDSKVAPTASAPSGGGDDFASDEEVASMVRKPWTYDADDDAWITAVTEKSGGKIPPSRALTLRYELLGAKDGDNYVYADNVIPSVTVALRGRGKAVLTDLPLNRSRAFARMREMHYRPSDLAKSIGKTATGERNAQRLMEKVLGARKEWKKGDSIAGRSLQIDSGKGGSVVKSDNNRYTQLTQSVDIDTEIHQAIDEAKRRIEALIDDPTLSVNSLDAIFRKTKRYVTAEDYPELIDEVKKRLEETSGLTDDKHDILDEKKRKRFIKNTVFNMLRSKANYDGGSIKSSGEDNPRDPVRPGHVVGRELNLGAAGKGDSGDELTPTDLDTTNTLGHTRSEDPSNRAARGLRAFDDDPFRFLSPEERASREAKLRKLRTLTDTEYRKEMERIRTLPPAEAERERRLLDLGPDVTPEDLETPEERVRRRQAASELQAALDSQDIDTYNNLLRKYKITGLPKTVQQYEREPEDDDVLAWRKKQSSVPISSGKPSGEQKPKVDRIAALRAKMKKTAPPPADAQAQGAYVMPDHRKYSFRHYFEVRQQQEAMIVGAQSQADAGRSAGGVWGDPASAAKITRQAHRDAAKRFGNR